MITYIFKDHVLTLNSGQYKLKKIGRQSETQTFHNLNDAIAKLLVERLKNKSPDHQNHIINQCLEAMLLRHQIKKLTYRKRELLKV